MNDLSINLEFKKLVILFQEKEDSKKSLVFLDHYEND